MPACSPSARDRRPLPGERRRTAKRAILPTMKENAIANRGLGRILLDELQLHLVLRREGALAQLVQTQLKETISLDVLHDKILATH